MSKEELKEKTKRAIEKRGNPIYQNGQQAVVIKTGKIVTILGHGYGEKRKYVYQRYYSTTQKPPNYQGRLTPSEIWPIYEEDLRPLDQ